MLSTATTAISLVLAPIALGALLGSALRHLRGHRFTGMLAVLASLAAPVVLVAAIALGLPIVGLWDACLVGLLLGVGVVWATHAALAGHNSIWLTAASLIGSLFLLEVACRVALPSPPGFPTGGGLHLFLTDAMRADAQAHSWGLRSKEIVASVLYEDRYVGLFDVSGESDVVVPRKLIARNNVDRRVLHIGDSMTFGFGVARDQTFTAVLESLEPHTQHINGGIPGTAPDAYLLVLRRWLDVQRVDMAVMYLFEGNDVVGLDESYPCCHWQALLTYESGGVAARCPTAPPLDLGSAGAMWLLHNSPPPYLVRALIPYSSAAAHIGAAIVSLTLQNPHEAEGSLNTRFSHLEAILRTARDDLARRQIPFVVVVLPDSGVFETPPRAPHLAPRMIELARGLNLRVLDASTVVSQALTSGGKIFRDGDPHFNAAGNQLIGRWLHQQLAADANP